MPSDFWNADENKLRTTSRSDVKADAKNNEGEKNAWTAHLLGKLTSIFTLQARYIHLNNRVSDKT